MPRILVTGASSGIGAATSARLRDDGVEVIELDRNPRDGALACDLADPGDIRRAAERIEAPLDGIAHVAGIPGTFAPGRILAVNFLGPRLLTDLVLPKLRAQSALVFVSSIASHRCTWSDAELARLVSATTWERAVDEMTARGTSGPQAYDLSKRLLAFTLPSLASDVARRRVRANLVSPGPVETPILGISASAWARIASPQRPSSLGVTRGPRRSRTPSRFSSDRRRVGSTASTSS